MSEDRNAQTEQDEDDLEVTPEALKDLTTSPEQANDVAGGATTPGGPGCYAGTW